MDSLLWAKKINIGGKEIKNRIAYPPLSTNLADNDGCVNEKILQNYRLISEGGCGMIIVEGSAVSQQGKGSSNSICLYDDRHQEGLYLLNNLIKKNNCFSSIQLMHAGGQANPDYTLSEVVSPSGIECIATKIKSRELTRKEIENIRESFIYSAKMAYMIGFDAVEFHLAHGYLLHQFISDYTNIRNDEYGGNLEGKSKLIQEIIGEIGDFKKEKKEYRDRVIGVRISGEDYIDHGVNFEVNKELVPILENLGVEYISITAGIYDSSKEKHYALNAGEFFRYSREIKNIVKNSKIIGVGKILDLESANVHLMNEDCDLVAIGRGLVADPQMVNKSINNLPYNRCTQCGECAYLKHKKAHIECPFREF